MTSVDELRSRTDEPRGVGPMFAPTSEIGRQMVDVAVELIDAGGESALHVQDVIDRVGVEVADVYRTFGGREGLVQSAQLERLRRDRRRSVDAVGALMAATTNEAEFRATIEGLLDIVLDPSRLGVRAKRCNVIGSTYGRPELAEAVGASERETIDDIVQMLGPAQAQGWIRPELDLEAFAWWFASQTLGRVVIELPGVQVDESAWNDLYRGSIRAALFGS